LHTAELTVPVWYRNAHWQTILPTLFRRVDFAYQKRERIEMLDGDFLDIDLFQQGSSKLVLLLHGLESSTQQTYMRGMASALSAQGYDIVALNFRGCSGTPNRLFRSYHSGVSEDIKFIFEYLLQYYPQYQYRFAVGFSLGGNVLLKWLGEEQEKLVTKLNAAIAISVPCDLKACAYKLALPQNKIYMNRFLKKLRQKMKTKIPIANGVITQQSLRQVKNFYDFDNLYTAPAHHFIDANDYWKKCSSIHFLPHIQVPTLLLNAQNDPFLTPECFPSATDISNPFVTLYYPKQGGHVGFLEKLQQKIYWHEQQVIHFLGQKL
jgi:predicted alpha/beta-fold hydrolase